MSLNQIFKQKEDVFKTAGQNNLWTRLSSDGTLRKLTFDDWYDSVSEIELDECVPEKVKYYFDSAQNVLLYSWFSYEMMPAAELLSYTLVEKALRIKYGCEKQSKPSFSQLIRQAADEGLLNDSGFHIPRNSIRQERIMENGTFTIKTYQRTEEELKACQDYIRPICNSLNKVRNILAHGNTCLHPAGWLTLKINSEIINMLFNCDTEPTSSDDIVSSSGRLTTESSM